MKPFYCFRATLTLLMTMFGVVLTQAADPNPDAPRGPRPDDNLRVQRRPGQPGERMVGVQPRAGGFPIESVLDEEQRAEFRQEMQAHRDELRDLEQKAAKFRREYDEALFAEKLDEKLVREKSTALAEIDTDRALIRARAFAKVRPSLSGEQLERLKNLRADQQRDMRPQPGVVRGPRDGDGQFDNRPDRPRRPRPPEADDRGTGLPPPAPPEPPPAPAPK
jgi:Spy/CpxP family protein refolding chaperone